MDAALKKRLTWTTKDPRRALANGWMQDPEFCRAFCDLCDQLALVLSPATFKLALRAVEFTGRSTLLRSSSISGARS